jgi:hypothetical protein
MGVDNESRSAAPSLILRGAQNVGGISDRKQEIKRRRHRRKKMQVFKRKLAKATVSEKAAIANKIRGMTPGAEVIISSLGLEERK